MTQTMRNFGTLLKGLCSEMILKGLRSEMIVLKFIVQRNPSSIMMVRGLYHAITSVPGIQFQRFMKA